MGLGLANAGRWRFDYHVARAWQLKSYQCCGLLFWSWVTQDGQRTTWCGKRIFVFAWTKAPDSTVRQDQALVFFRPNRMNRKCVIDGVLTDCAVFIHWHQSSK